MIRSVTSNSKNIARGVLLFVFPWFPAYLFERIDFYFGIIGNGYLYYQLTGPRLEVDVVSFALGGILVAYLLRPRWAIVQILLNAALIWILFYVACPTFRGANGLLHSECYATGPDGLAGFRLVGMMFSYGVLPTIVKAASKSGITDRRVRLGFALFGGVVLTEVMVWFPLAAWFSGVTYLQSVVIFQILILAGVPQLATGMLTARIGRSLSVATASGVVALLATTLGFWTLSCPSCDRSMLYSIVPSWAIFAFLGGVTELGLPARFRFAPRNPWLKRVKLADVQRIALALVMMVSLSTLVVRDFWDPRVLYEPSISPGFGDLTLGQSSYPYVAGYYNSSQYRICCLELGVSFVEVNPQSLAPNNFLMAGMGVQSPNCCIDGWDLGWRADVFLLPNSSLILSGSSWTTCDSNANCGGNFWQDLRYHAQVTLNPQNLSARVYLRMMWEPVAIDGQMLYTANWYYNTTGVPWTRFGTFLPDFREGNYFDIGLPGGGVYFYQFGVASKTPVSGWKVLLLYPSFQYPPGTWRVMERANTIQGDRSWWKASYRWGGSPYPGVTARANLQDHYLPPGIVEFSYTGGTMQNNSPLW